MVRKFAVHENPYVVLYIKIELETHKISYDLYRNKLNGKCIYQNILNYADAKHLFEHHTKQG